LNLSESAAVHFSVACSRFKKTFPNHVVQKDQGEQAMMMFCARPLRSRCASMLAAALLMLSSFSSVLGQEPATETATPAASAEANPETPAVTPEAASTVTPHLAGEIDTGSTTWLLVSAALVCFMMPGLALFYGGMVRAKNVHVRDGLYSDHHRSVGCLRLQLVLFSPVRDHR
jgi:hypothetical protein